MLTSSHNANNFASVSAPNSAAGTWTGAISGSEGNLGNLGKTPKVRVYRLYISNKNGEIGMVYYWKFTMLAQSDELTADDRVRFHTAPCANLEF